MTKQEVSLFYSLPDRIQINDIEKHMRLLSLYSELHALCDNLKNNMLYGDYLSNMNCSDYDEYDNYQYDFDSLENIGTLEGILTTVGSIITTSANYVWKGIKWSGEQIKKGAALSYQKIIKPSTTWIYQKVLKPTYSFTTKSIPKAVKSAFEWSKNQIVYGANKIWDGTKWVIKQVGTGISSVFNWAFGSKGQEGAIPSPSYTQPTPSPAPQEYAYNPYTNSYIPQVGGGYYYDPNTNSYIATGGSNLMSPSPAIVSGSYPITSTEQVTEQSVSQVDTKTILYIIGGLAVIYLL